VEKDRWKEEGAHALEHAAELGADVQKGLVASTMMNHRFGEREASIRSLQRIYALTDDEATRAEITAKLEVLESSRESDRTQCVIQTVDAQWHRELPFMSREVFMLLGPLHGPASCAGVAAGSRRECALSWDDAVAGACLDLP
jgi:hypothetical protein